MQFKPTSAKRAVRPPEPAGAYPLALLIASSGVPAGLAFAAIYLGTAVSPTSWYIARASGLTLYLLLWASAMFGLGMTTGIFDRWGSRGTIYSLHRFVTGLSYGFLSAHVLSLVIDPTVSFGLSEIVIPFKASWGEPWTGMGVVASYLLAVIGVSSAMMRRINFRIWKALHRLAFPMYVLALAHGVGSGTDTGRSIVTGMYWVTAGCLLCLLLFRLLRVGKRAAPATMQRSMPLDRMNTRQSA